MTKEELEMTKSKECMLDEIKTIEKECIEKGISANECIERYAEDYYNNKKKSHWAWWLNWVNDN